MARRNIKFRDRRSTGSRLNELIENRMNERISKPLTKNPNRKVDKATKIEKIIKEPEVLVKTGKPLEDNIVITKEDKATDAELVNLVKVGPTLGETTKDIVDAILNPEVADIISDEVLDTKDYDDEDKRRIYIEEIERRQIEDERFKKIQEAFNDEIERREAFRIELKQMKLDFELYLKEKYPDIVGEKSIKDVDIKKKKEEAIRLKEDALRKQKILKQRMIKRVEEEKLRKKKELKMLTSTKTEKNVSTFLEEEIIIEQQVKKQKNPELDGLNEVERTIKEVKLLCDQLGRAIVPHRDIVDNDESDFDSDTSTKSTDILIKPSQKSPFENYEEKREVLEVLRKSLGKENTEEDLCVKYDKEDRNNYRK